MEVEHTKHVTYKLAYHFVWCPKYRKHILTGRVATCVEQELRRICQANTWTIGALNGQEDYVHLFLSAAPSIAPSQQEAEHYRKGQAQQEYLRRSVPA
jgi:putative transposase